MKLTADAKFVAGKTNSNQCQSFMQAGAIAVNANVCPLSGTDDDCTLQGHSQ